MEPVFTYTRTGYSFTVYPNRIETHDTSGFGAFTGGKRESYPIKNISDVTISGVLRKLKITMNNGKAQEFMLGTESEEARQAILPLL